MLTESTYRGSQYESLGFDHGAGHPLLFLDDAKAPNRRKNNGFKDLGNYSEWPKVAGAMIKANLSIQRMKKMAETYISVDVETAGPIPGAYSLLAIGACVVGNPKETFYTELCPINEAFVSPAMEAIGRTFNEFIKSGRNPLDAMREFRTWIDRVSYETTPVFVGFNATFDWSFINWYFHTYLRRGHKSCRSQ